MNTMMMGFSSVINTHYLCSNCGRDLWDRNRRLKNQRKAPTVMIIRKKLLCDKCYFKIASKPI